MNYEGLTAFGDGTYLKYPAPAPTQHITGAAVAETLMEFTPTKENPNQAVLAANLVVDYTKGAPGIFDFLAVEGVKGIEVAMSRNNTVTHNAKPSSPAPVVH